MNRCIFIGRLANEPQLKQTPQGVSVCRFSLAVQRSYKKNDGETADFISVVAWRDRAEFAATHLHKGTKIILEARARTCQYEKNGQRHFVTEFHADAIEFVESGSTNAKNPPYEPPAGDGFTDIDDPDLPWN